MAGPRSQKKNPMVLDTLISQLTLPYMLHSSLCLSPTDTFSQPFAFKKVKSRELSFPQLDAFTTGIHGIPHIKHRQSHWEPHPISWLFQLPSLACPAPTCQPLSWSWWGPPPLLPIWGLQSTLQTGAHYPGTCTRATDANDKAERNPISHALQQKLMADKRI